MRDLLMLTHRLPFPPDKGDKIRSFHWLTGLASHYRVHLGTFVDDVADERHLSEVSRYCAGMHVARLGRHATFRAALSCLPRREPVSIGLYRNAALGRWIDATCARHDIEAVLGFSSGVGPYLQRPALRHARRVLDFVDVDSDKWRQYTHRTVGPRRWIYAREARLLEQTEAVLAGAVDAAVLVSDDETALFRRRISSTAHLETVGNGVDCGYFDPDQSYDMPYAGGHAVVFTGAMDYAANADAVAWFAGHVLPMLRAQCPEVVFYIVGSRPTNAVRRLAALSGVEVTGRVPDIRPYLAHAAVAVAPLRVARGIQNKVLEALAMDRPVVATPQAVEGLPAVAAFLDAITEDGAAMARDIARVLSGKSRLGRGTRRACVRAHYGWGQSVARLQALLDGNGSR